MNALVVVIDGASDRILKKYKKTPLEMANTPNLDEIAKRGLCGQLSAIGTGNIPGSDTAHLAILGYDPYRFYTGRGPIEARGAGVELDKSDISMRCNYATVDEKFNIISRTAGQVSDGLGELESAINGIDIGCEFVFKNSLGYRCVLCLKEEGLSANITDSDKNGFDWVRPKDRTMDAKRTADIVNTFMKKTNEVLSRHPVNENRKNMGKLPANMILPRGAGSTPELTDFYEKWGIKGCVVSGIGLIKGIGYLANMDVVNVPTATGYIDTNLKDKADAAIKALRTHDLVLMHIESIDELSHDKDIKGKVKELERIDGMFGYLLDHLDNNLLVVLSDHTTSTDLGDHTADPTPIVFYNGDFVPDEAGRFTEREMYKGGLGRISGMDVVPLITDQINKTKKFGA